MAADGWCGYLAVELVHRRLTVPNARCLDLRAGADRVRFDGFLRDLIGWTTDGAVQANVGRLREHLERSSTPHVLLQDTGL